MYIQFYNHYQLSFPFALIKRCCSIY